MTSCGLSVHWWEGHEIFKMCNLLINLHVSVSCWAWCHILKEDYLLTCNIFIASCLVDVDQQSYAIIFMFPLILISKSVFYIDLNKYSTKILCHHYRYIHRPHTQDIYKVYVCLSLHHVAVSLWTRYIYIKGILITSTLGLSEEWRETQVLYRC